MRCILVEEIKYTEFKDIQEDNSEVFYEEGMRFFKFSTEDRPLGLINIWCKKNVINTRNFYIYKQERNKNLTKVLIKELLLLTKRLHPNTKTLWWSTTLNSSTIKISEMLHENKVIEKNNPNRFCFRDNAPCYLFWSDFNKLIERVMNEQI